MNSVQKSKPLANSSRKTPKSTSNSKRALDDILGKARNTLDQSRQFRDAQLAGLRQPRNGTVGRGGSAKPNFFNAIRNLPLAELAATVPLRRPGATGFEAQQTVDYEDLLRQHVESMKSDSGQRHSTGATAVSNQQNNNTSDDDDGSSSSISETVEEGRSSSNEETSEGESSEGETDSDSTITPPTITGTTESSKRKVKEKPPAAGAGGSLDFSNINSFSNKKEKNLLERTLLIRGDPVSHESYAVLKAMMFEKEHREVDQSQQSLIKSYTEDFATDHATDSIEVPKTATEIDSTEIPEDDNDNGDFDTFNDLQSSASSVKMSEKASSLIVEQISENLKVLEVSDFVLHDEGEEPIPNMEEQIALHDLKVLAEMEKEKDDELYSIMGKSSLAASSTVASSPIVKSQSQGRGRASGTTTTSKKSIKNIKDVSSSSKSIPQSHKVSSASIYSMLSESRQSSRKTFQRVLSKLKIDDEKDVDIDNVEEKNVDYVPPTTRPQRNIQSILEKEVYQKELKKIRNMQKREELQKKRVSETRAQTLRAVQAAEDSGIVYKEPSYTKILLPELINDPMIASTAKTSKSNLGAPYFNLNGSLGFDYSVENYPRTPDGNFNSEVAKMDIPQLVREVLASNERMYKMTVDAADEMGKEYGKNTKMLLKIKKNKELQRRQKN